MCFMKTFISCGDLERKISDTWRCYGLIPEF